MVKLAAKLVRTVRAFGKDLSGGVLIYTGMALPIFLGVAGLAVDVSIWHSYNRQTQSIADSAATAGALELIRRINADAAARTNFGIAAAQTDAAINNYIDPAVDNTSEFETITINVPPTSGDYQGATDSIEVIVRRRVPTFVSGMIFPSQASVASRAVARGGLGEGCIFSLNSSASPGFKASGNVDINLDCGIFVNAEPSSGDSGVKNGTGCVNAKIVKMAGTSDGCFSPAPFENVPPVNDPFATISPPDHDAMPCETVSDTNLGNGETMTLTPGKYCDSIRVTGGELILEPGTYVFDGATLDVTGGTVRDSDPDPSDDESGVTLYWSENTAKQQEINFAGGANIDLTASATGDYAGMLVYVDRGATATNVTHSFTGGVTQSLEGVIYIPNQDVKYAGGTGTEAVMLVADEIDIVGNAEFGNLAGSVIANNANLASAKLVE